jgi:hypothetical protein
MSAVLKPKNSKPVRERVSREEWPALLRLLERRGINYLG